MTRPLACHCGNSRHRGTTNHGERWVCDDCHCLYATPEAEFPLDYGREPECRALEERWQREHGACGAMGEDQGKAPALLPNGAVYAGQTVAIGTQVHAAHSNSTRQHFSGLDPEEGEKIEMTEEQSRLELGDSLVAKVGLETPADAPPAEGRKPRGRPRKDQASKSLQDGKCRDGVNGPADQRSAGPRQSAGGVPDLNLAMGAMAAMSHMDAAIGQLEATRSGDVELPLPLRLWLARALYHMGETATWLGVVRVFASAWPAPIGELTHVTLVLPGEQRVSAKLEAVCGRYVCVSAEVDAIFAVCPRWVGWFDGQTGRWLADGQEPAAWSDRITLQCSSLPGAIRAEVDAQ